MTVPATAVLYPFPTASTHATPRTSHAEPPSPVTAKAAVSWASETSLYLGPFAAWGSSGTRQPQRCSDLDRSLRRAARSPTRLSPRRGAGAGDSPATQRAPRPRPRPAPAPSAAAAGARGPLPGSPPTLPARRRSGRHPRTHTPAAAPCSGAGTRPAPRRRPPAPRPPTACQLRDRGPGPGGRAAGGAPTCSGEDAAAEPRALLRRRAGPRPPLRRGRHAPLALGPATRLVRALQPLNGCLRVAAAIAFAGAAAAAAAAVAGLENISGCGPSLTTAASLPAQPRSPIGCGASRDARARDPAAGTRVVSTPPLAGEDRGWTPWAGRPRRGSTGSPRGVRDQSCGLLELGEDKRTQTPSGRRIVPRGGHGSGRGRKPLEMAAAQRVFTRCSLQGRVDGGSARPVPDAAARWARARRGLRSAAWAAPQAQGACARLAAPAPEPGAARTPRTVHLQPRPHLVPGPRHPLYVSVRFPSRDGGFQRELLSKTEHDGTPVQSNQFGRLMQEGHKFEPSQSNLPRP